ncbi:hypothetical protein K9M48_05025 [Candidatus Gracilibacteria bacterium]|nr:hypothetical protein [Candidatus Gracilibacteria bacterium]
MSHKNKVEKYNGTITELGEDIGNLDYDALAELFAVLTAKFKKDSINDMNLGHPQVSEKLKNISKGLKDILENEVEPLADLCRPYNEKGIK